MAKTRKPGKGQRVRPCTICGEPVNFVLWASETKKRGKRIFHWANVDGSHHYHHQTGRDHEGDLTEVKKFLRTL